MKLAQKMSRIGTESAFEVLARARALEKQGRNIIHLEIGEPDVPTPAHIVEAGKRALDEGWTKYGPTQGFPEVREAIASYISRTRKIAVGAENVCVVPGGKPIMYFVMTALLEAGDEVVFPDPSFPIYESLIHFLGATAVGVPVVESRGFSFDLETLRRSLSDKTKLVILNSPANPTGGVIPKDDIAQMAALLRDRDLIVMSDEIYSRIWYESEPTSISSYDGMLDKTVILDGFSKTYSMTGWRLGYGVMPTWLAAAVVQLMVNSNSCTASFFPAGGDRGARRSSGLRDGDGRRIPQAARRDREGIEHHSRLPLRSAAGAFYAFPNVSGTKLETKALADLLLNEAGVACLDARRSANTGGTPAIQLREFAREHPRGHRTDSSAGSSVGREAFC